MSKIAHGAADRRKIAPLGAAGGGAVTHTTTPPQVPPGLGLIIVSVQGFDNRLYRNRGSPRGRGGQERTGGRRSPSGGSAGGLATERELYEKTK
jgi:hypothetical protein